MHSLTRLTVAGPYMQESKEREYLTFQDKISPFAEYLQKKREGESLDTIQPARMITEQYPPSIQVLHFLKFNMNKIQARYNTLSSLKFMKPVLTHDSHIIAPYISLGELNPYYLHKPLAIQAQHRVCRMCMHKYIEELVLPKVQFYVENNLMEEFEEVADQHQDSQIYWKHNVNKDFSKFQQYLRRKKMNQLVREKAKYLIQHQFENEQEKARFAQDSANQKEEKKEESKVESKIHARVLRIPDSLLSCPCQFCLRPLSLNYTLKQESWLFQIPYLEEKGKTAVQIYHSEKKCQHPQHNSNPQTFSQRQLLVDDSYKKLNHKYSSNPLNEFDVLREHKFVSFENKQEITNKMNALVKLYPCGHYICKSCFQIYLRKKNEVEAKLTLPFQQLICPVVDCRNGFIDQTSLQTLLRREPHYFLKLQYIHQMPRYIREKDRQIPCPFLLLKSAERINPTPEMFDESTVHYLLPNSNLEHNYCHHCDKFICKKCFHEIKPRFGRRKEERKEESKEKNQLFLEDHQCGREKTDPFKVEVDVVRKRNQQQFCYYSFNRFNYALHPNQANGDIVPLKHFITHKLNRETKRYTLHAGVVGSCNSHQNKTFCSLCKGKDICEHFTERYFHYEEMCEQSLKNTQVINLVPALVEEKEKFKASNYDLPSDLKNLLKIVMSKGPVEKMVEVVQKKGGKGKQKKPRKKGN